MVFACQRDSFLKNLKTKVLSCKASKRADKEEFEVILEDTVLFPEGGGQVGPNMRNIKVITVSNYREIYINSYLLVNWRDIGLCSGYYYMAAREYEFYLECR